MIFQEHTKTIPCTVLLFPPEPAYFLYFSFFSNKCKQYSVKKHTHTHIQGAFQIPGFKVEVKVGGGTLPQKGGH